MFNFNNDIIVCDTMTVEKIDLSDIETEYGSDHELPISSIASTLLPIIKKEVETSENFDCQPESNINIDDESQTSLTSDKYQNNLAERYECDVCGKTFFKRNLVIEHFQTSLCFPVSSFYSENVSSKNYCINNTDNDIENKILSIKAIDKIPINYLEESRKLKTGQTAIEKNKLMKKNQTLHTNENNLKCNDFANFNDKNENTQFVKKKWKCLTCGESFTKLSTLKAHRSIHSKKIQFNCDKCNKSFFNLNSLEKHKTVHTFSCHICHELFTELSSYIVHKKNHNLKRINHCNVDKKHLNLKSNTSQKYECSSCSKVFHKRFEIITHIFEKHQEEYSRYSCDTCIKLNVSSNDLILRIEKNVFKCDVCPQSFTTSHKLHQHYKWHIGANNFKCQYCPKTFSQYSDCLSHEKTHVGDKPFLCSFCAKWFPASSNINIHLGYQNPYVNNNCLRSKVLDLRKKKQLKDENCNKTYCQSPTSESNASCSRYNCNLCDKSFVHLSTLKLHLKTHNRINLKRNNSNNKVLDLRKKKQLKDENCNKTYCQSPTSESNASCSRYNCNLCDKSFVHLSTLKLHLKTHNRINLKRNNSCKKTIKKLSLIKTRRSKKNGYLNNNLCLKKIPKSNISGTHKCKSSYCRCQRILKDSSSSEKHHKDIVFKKIYKCDVCGSLYVNLISLNKHKETHMTSENEMYSEISAEEYLEHLKNELYECDHCLEIMNGNLILTHIMNIH